MSTKTSHSTLTDVPNITNAVERLQELGVRMKSDEFGFGDTDVNNIDDIIDAIKEVETECYKLHEKLETETIKASVLRHKLHFFPGEINAEIQAAIDSARKSNAEELNSLQQKLKNITDNIEYLTKRHKELEEENATLHPQRDGVREEHEEIIAQLNQRMAEKASKQITLNETRDAVRDTNQQIVDLEDGILQLKEDLIQERADARMEKKRLKKAVYDTTVKTKEQKEMNVTQKKELDELHGKVMDSEGKLETVRKSVRRYETSKQRMEGQERALSKQMEKETSENDQLKVDGALLARQIADDRESFKEKKKRLENRMKQLEANMKDETKRNQELSGQKIELSLELEEKTKIRRLDEHLVKEQNQVLQAAKENLAFKAEEVARLQQENIDIERRIVELGDSHNAIVATLQRQTEEYRDQLTRERHERMDLQDQRDSVQQDLDDTRLVHMRFMNERNRAINDGKQRHDQLTHEGTQLQKDNRLKEESIRQLQAERVESQKEYEVKRTELRAEIERMETEIKMMQEEIVEREATIVEQTPGFQDLEATFDERTKSFDQIKKDIVSMKNQKQGLEDMVKQSEMQLQKMVRPQEELKRELKKERGKSLQQLQGQSEEVMEVERSMYTVGCKLETALLQNHRFKQANDKLDEEIASLKDQTEENEELVIRLTQLFGTMRESLEEDWHADHQMEREHSARDSLLLVELGDLLSTAQRREEIIGNITDNLYSELKVLAEFLDNVARRRPKDSRQGKKPRPQTSQARSPRSAGAAKSSSHKPDTQTSPRKQEPSPRPQSAIPEKHS